MVYPVEIVAQLTSKFNLDASQQAELEQTLRVPGIQPMIESHFLESERLIAEDESDKRVKVILAPNSAQNIVIAFPYSSLEKKAFLNNWIALVLKIALLNYFSGSRQGLHRRKALAEQVMLEVMPVISSELLEHQNLLAEYTGISKQISQYINKLTQPIEEAATRYFNELFLQNGKTIKNITFHNKRAGVQIGITMHIDYSDALGEYRAIFHIKTHQYGSTTIRSSIEPVDSKELYIYRVLEYTGNGPKAHFFLNPLSHGGFFIATQDLAFSKLSKRKQFTSFDNVMENYNATPDSDDIQHEKARLGLVRLDILSRILRINDTTMNPGNFGFVTIDETREKWKILDFRTPDKETSDTYNNPNIFDGFYKGNGVFNYDYANFLRYIFKNPTQMNHKFDMAYEVVKELELGKASQSREGIRKMPLLSAMDKALEEITAYVQANSAVMRVDAITALDDLTQYHAALRHNYWTLTTGIRNQYNQLHGIRATFV